VATDLAEVRGESLDAQLDVFVRGVVRRMEDVPKSLAELVIHSQRVALMKARAAGGRETSARFADLLREVLTEARRRGEIVSSADPAELGEILGALTMDAIEGWASGRAGDKPLEEVLRFRVALVVEPFSARARGRRSSGGA
jgi:hypothetical protein